MNDRRLERLKSWLTEAASEFIARNVAFPATLITVTRAEIESNFERATVYISVWPESREADVMKAIRPLRREFYDYAKKKFTMRQRMPVNFEIDAGEKARRRFEEALRGDKK